MDRIDETVRALLHEGGFDSWMRSGSAQVRSITAA
jgi:hypothetical protein